MSVKKKFLQDLGGGYSLYQVSGDKIIKGQHYRSGNTVFFRVNREGNWDAMGEFKDSSKEWLFPPKSSKWRNALEEAFDLLEENV